MKNIIALLCFGAAFIAVIYTGMWYVQQKNQQYLYQQQNQINPVGNLVPDEDTQIAGSDPFGLFGADEAQYEITIQVNWNSRNHGQYYPSSARLSQPVTWTGSNNPVFFIGQNASAGMIEFAESGRTRGIKKELEDLRELGRIDQFEITDVVDAPGANTYTMTINRDSPVVSIAAALLPSPDWFVTLEGLNLLEDNRWKTGVTVSGIVLDVGSQAGNSFVNSTAASETNGVITSLSDIPVQTLPAFVTFQFRQINI